MSAHASIASLGWLVFVELPLGEAVAPLYSSLVRTGVLLAVGIAYRNIIGMNFPAMAVIGITDLVEPEALIEIETTAVIPD